MSNACLARRSPLLGRSRRLADVDIRFFLDCWACIVKEWKMKKENKPCGIYIFIYIFNIIYILNFNVEIGNV